MQALACATPQPCMRTKSAQTVIPMPFFPGLQGCSGLKGVCLPPDVLATLQPLGLLDRSEHRSVGSEGGDDVVHSRAEDVLLYKLSTSYRQVHVPGPGSRAGCETSMRSATVRGGSNPEGRVRAIFSIRACANRRATFRTWHLSEGLNSLLTTAWHIRYSPIGAASYIRFLAHGSPSVPTVTFAASYAFRPSVSTSIIASGASVKKSFGRLCQLILITHFELLTLEFIVGIVGIDGGGAALPTIPTIPTMFFCRIGSFHAQFLRR